MNAIYFMAGAWLVGSVFTYLTVKEGFAFDNGPEWCKVVISGLIAATWPFLAFVALLGIIKDSVWKLKP